MVQSQGSDATIRMGDLLPSVLMDEPPDNIAAEFDAMTTNPYLHFEIAPYGPGALEFMPGKNYARDWLD